jgi:uncharacterized Zn-binding protein involved in type VI secretion
MEQEMPLRIITAGDKTDRDGTVISGSLLTRFAEHAVARLGDHAPVRNE